MQRPSYRAKPLETANLELSMENQRLTSAINRIEAFYAEATRLRLQIRESLGLTNRFAALNASPANNCPVCDDIRPPDATWCSSCGRDVGPAGAE